MCCDINRAMRHAWWWLVDGWRLRCMCVRPLFRSYLQPPPPPQQLLFLLSAGLRVAAARGSLSVLLPAPPLSYPITSPPFRRLLCPYYGALRCLQPPPWWWSSYAATYSPPTYHFCSRPASGSLSVLLPTPTTTPLFYPVISPPFRRLLCPYYGALQPRTWWSSYAATYSPPTYHFCARPASGSLCRCCYRFLLPPPCSTPSSAHPSVACHKI
jgi:hypothetical protein